MMKKYILPLIAILLSVALLSSCGTYDPIESTDEELRVIGTVNGLDVCYDELRCAAINTKKLMSEEYGIDWSKSEDAEKYREELEKRVYEGLIYNYAVQLILSESGYTLDTQSIKDAVQSEMVQLIDECGGRGKYKKYLKENHLTDRVVRLNLSISYALNELVFLLNDQGIFDEYVDFDIERINAANELYYSEEDFFEAYLMLLGGGIFLRSEDVFIPASRADGEALANSLLEEAKGGKSLEDLAEEKGLSYENIYQFKGELDPSFFSAVASVNENELTAVKLDAGWYVIRRLAPEESYVYLNCYDLAYKYVFIKMDEYISEYEKNLSIEFTDFGRTVDLTKIN